MYVCVGVNCVPCTYTLLFLNDSYLCGVTHVHVCVCVCVCVSICAHTCLQVI